MAKKLYYRASTLKARDVYDLSTAIDLDPESAREAMQACVPERAVLLQRLVTMRALTDDEMLAGLQPYDGPLRHGRGMVQKVIDFIAALEAEQDGVRRSIPRDRAAHDERSNGGGAQRRFQCISSPRRRCRDLGSPR